MAYLLVTLGGLGLAAVAVALWRAVERAREREAESRIADLSVMGEVVAGGRYPKIDPDRCIGSGACVAACPEKEVLGLTQGRGRLINPLGCVGHGLCAKSCPMDAITLVYGSPTQKRELPRLDEHHQADQPGVYVVGSLSGRGLIRNAVAQGAEAAAHIAAGERRGAGEVLDALVVGAGPAGIAATLGLLEAELRVALLDREELGGTIRHYPRAKVVMTGDLDFPIYGRVRRRTMSKEELLALWSAIDEKASLPLRPGELVEGVTIEEDGTFAVRTGSGITRAANVVLALGIRGAPRKLGVPGEELEKVSYSVIEPEEFVGQRVLVVGGGNSAVENAIALAEGGGCASVAISYRREHFARCRGDNRRRIEELVERGRVRSLMPTTVERIEEGRVVLRWKDGREETLENDRVVVQIGGTPPSGLLREFGVRLVAKRGDE